MEMGFNIWSRQGWFRLWVLCSIVWGFASVVLLDIPFPTKAGFDQQLEWSLTLAEGKHWATGSRQRTPDEVQRLKTKA